MDDDDVVGSETELDETVGADNSGSETDWKVEAEKWKRLSRDNETRAKSNADAAKRLAEMEEADKSEMDKLTERLTAAELKAAEAERLEVAFSKAPDHLTRSQILKLAKRISGATREEMDADADELFAEFAVSGAPPRKNPAENLRGGSHDDSPRVDASALAKEILGGGQL